MRINGGILGRTVTAILGGRYNAVEVNLLRKTNLLDTYLIDVVAVGAGGGAGGYDGPVAGAGGGSGSCVSGTMEVTKGAVYYIGVGGGGGTGGSAQGGGTGSGQSGINGGGQGGQAGITPSSGAGGGGGGWTGIYKDFTFYIVAGGGSGGGGSNEGGANDTPAAGGGKQYQGSTTTMEGAPGQYYAADGGGGAAGGGGYLGGEGQAQLAATAFQTSGGGNYVHPSIISPEIKNGNDGSTSGTGGSANVTNRFGFVTGNGDGAGGTSNLSNGTNGNLTIRYAGPQRGTGGTVTNSGGYTYHHYGTAANAGTLLFIA